MTYTNHRALVSTTIVRTRALVLSICSVSRWLPRDLIHKTLREINTEIEMRESMPLHDRTVADAERIKDLHEARSRITGFSRGS